MRKENQESSCCNFIQVVEIKEYVCLFVVQDIINGLDIALTEQEALRLKFRLQFMEVKAAPGCDNEFTRLRQFFNNLRYFYEDFIFDGKRRIAQCRLLGR